MTQSSAYKRAAYKITVHRALFFEDKVTDVAQSFITKAKLCAVTAIKHNPTVLPPQIPVQAGPSGAQSPVFVPGKSYFGKTVYLWLRAPAKVYWNAEL